MSNLNDIQAAKEAMEAAEQHYRRTIADAVDGGVPISKIARATGMTRQTIYNWIDKERG